MLTRRLPWKNLTVLIIGAAGLATWMMGACDSVDDGAQETRRGMLRGPRAGLDPVNAAPPDYVVTPGGFVVHKDCVHQVPDGATANADLSVTLNGKKIAQYAACSHKRYRMADATDGAVTVPGTGNGWVETSWANTTSTEFNHLDVGYWIVPANPVNHGQLIYLFPSLTNDNSIVQPVLQWGNNGSFGGASWVYANWWVENASTFFVSSVNNANPGDQIWGSMDLSNQIGSNQYWNIQIKDVTTGQTIVSNFVVPEPDLFTAAQAGALEAYRISTCDSFPSGSSGQTYFPQPQLYQGTSYFDRNFASNSVSWFARNASALGWTGPICGFGATVATNGNTWLNY